MILIVTGSRYLRNRRAFEDAYRKALEGLDVSEIWTGDAAGADNIAREIAEECGAPCRVFRAHWQKYGSMAGPRRNREMVVAAKASGEDVRVLALPLRDVPNRGTRNCIKQAREHGLTVHVVMVSNEEGS